jgi:predicted DNA-binding transcriptional regulator YafY
MGDFQILDRFIWFDQQIRHNRYPNATSLAEEFELANRTARRNINYMRDYLGVPLEYHPVRKGYYYSDDSFAMPPLQVSQEELLALLLARNLLSGSADGLISDSIKKVSKKIFAATGSFGLTESRMTEMFSATWNGYSPTQADVFRQAADALLRRRLLSFVYRSPRKNDDTLRCVEPHHLQHYMGSWVLLGWCRERQDWRKFYLARMESVAVPEESFVPKAVTEWQYLVEGSYGIFQGRETKNAVLLFSPERARWIREQLWHPSQQIEEREDGSLQLTIPVADFREIKLRIMQYGADVEVVEPQELRDEISKEIAAMAMLYGTPAE